MYLRKPGGIALSLGKLLNLKGVIYRQVIRMLNLSMHETHIKHSAWYRNISVQYVILSMNQDNDSAVYAVGRCRCVDIMVCDNIFIY